MTIKTILIINCIVLTIGVISLIALGIFIRLHYKAEKKAELEKVKNLTNHCIYLNSKLIACEERVDIAYEIGYKEGKNEIQKQTANECYKKILEWHPITKSDKDNYCKFINTLKRWLKENYEIGD